MRHVWKCDFCNFTDRLQLAVKEHEQYCDYNPVNTDCITCANRITPGIDYLPTICRVKEPAYMVQVDKGQIICDR